MRNGGGLSAHRAEGTEMVSGATLFRAGLRRPEEPRELQTDLSLHSLDPEKAVVLATEPREQASGHTAPVGRVQVLHMQH
jgi:hypothetical protein